MNPPEHKASVTDTRGTVARITAFFETLSPQSLGQLGMHYAEDAHFKDPFNEVQGLPAIERIFVHMFENLHEPRFVVTQQIADGAQAFLVWEFHFRMKRFDTTTHQVIRGGSHLALAPDGRIQTHRDYWDAAEELYEKLPLLGRLMRWLKKQAVT